MDNQTMSSKTGECREVYVGLALTALALLISVSLNVLLYILRRKQNRDAVKLLHQDSFHSYRFEEDEQINHENPIYGNIHLDGGGFSVTDTYTDYECMTKESARQDRKGEPTDLNYASLDLRVVQKQKKKRKYQQNKSQTHQVQTHPPPTGQPRCVERGVDRDVALPSRSSSLMMSRSSIYLNSHQVALEAEELEREREKERKNHRVQEMEKLNLHCTFDQGQSEPCHEQES